MNKKFRHLLGMLASILLVASVAIPAHADGETWAGGGPPDFGTYSFEINEVAHAGNSSRTIFHTRESQTPSWQYYCPVFNQSPNCQLPESNSTFHASVFAVFPTCQISNVENCIEDLYISNTNGEFVKAEYIRNVYGPNFSEDKSLGLIEGTTQSLFRVPGVLNGGGTDTYIVNLRAQQDYIVAKKKFVIGEFAATVLPYREISSSDQNFAYTEILQPTGTQVVGANGNPKCAWSEAGLCGVRLRYAEGQKVKLVFRATNTLVGWFSGRIKTPDLKIETYNSTSNRFTVSGTPVLVPQFRAVVPKSSTLPFVVENIKQNPNMSGMSNNANSGEGSFGMLAAFKEEVKDTSVGFINPFSLSTVRGGSGCFADTSKVLGIVTTDAMVFEGKPPVFKDGQLTYRVAGLHYEPDGVTAVSGNYDLVMRSEVARCLYGFTSAPVQASISVISEAGENKIATTKVFEERGWLKLAAYGFTFSNPTISVKLSQVKKKTTITCIKGKVVRKVLGVSPKCPSGYKKKD